MKFHFKDESHAYGEGRGFAARCKAIVSICGQEEHHKIENTVEGVIINRFDQAERIRVRLGDGLAHLYHEELSFADYETVIYRKYKGCIDRETGEEAMVVANVMRLITDSMRWRVDYADSVDFETRMELDPLYREKREKELAELARSEAHAKRN